MSDHLGAGISMAAAVGSLGVLLNDFLEAQEALGRQGGVDSVQMVLANVKSGKLALQRRVVKRHFHRRDRQVELLPESVSRAPAPSVFD